MSAMHPMGAAMRTLRTDRSVVDQKLTRRTVVRIFGFAKPHSRLLVAFIGFVIVDAALVVVNPLLVKALLDDGIKQGNGQLVTMLALAMVGVSLSTRPSAWAVVTSPRASARTSSSTCARRSSATSSGCRWRSSPAPRPAPWCPGSTTT